MGTINWKAFFAAALKEAPRVIQTIAVIHAEKDTESKAALAATALVSAAGVAADLDPADKDSISDAASLAQGIITAWNAQPPSSDVVVFGKG